MIISFYTGVSGMVSFQKGMDVLAHNMANVNTTGYKTSKAAFADLLYSRMDTNGQQEHLVGHGVKVLGTDLIFEQGKPMSTGNVLDFALIGDGFFAVDRGGENPEYTRNGAFTISVEGNKGFLATQDGGYVLDAKGKRIELDKKEGSERFEFENISQKLGIYTFPNPYGLQPANGGSFLETVISGEAKAFSGNGEEPYTLIQFALESSSVDLSQQMADVITTQRAFQFNAKIVQTADQIEEIVNSLR